MKIVFFGTPRFAVEVLKALLQEPVEIVAIVTKPEKPQGRSLKVTPSPVKLFAAQQSWGIEILEPVRASNPEFIQLIQDRFSPDLFVVVGFGEILSQDLLNVPRLAAVNIHTSLLPGYRGAAPIQRAMMAHEKEMGITVMKMNSKMDAGEILLKKSCEIDDRFTFLEVEARLIELAKSALVEFLRASRHFLDHAQSQDLSRVSSAPKLSAEDLKIEFGSKGKAQRQIMALSPKPGAYVECAPGQSLKRIKILKAIFSDEKLSASSKTLFEFEKKLYLAFDDGALEVLFLQIEGKNSVSAKDFLNGHRHLLPLFF